MSLLPLPRKASLPSPPSLCPSVCLLARRTLLCAAEGRRGRRERERGGAAASDAGCSTCRQEARIRCEGPLQLRGGRADFLGPNLPAPPDGQPWMRPVSFRALGRETTGEKGSQSRPTRGEGRGTGARGAVVRHQGLLGRKTLVSATSNGRTMGARVLESKALSDHKNQLQERGIHYSGSFHFDQKH